MINMMMLNILNIDLIWVFDVLKVSVSSDIPSSVLLALVNRCTTSSLFHCFPCAKKLASHRILLIFNNLLGW